MPCEEGRAWNTLCRTRRLGVGFCCKDNSTTLDESRQLRAVERTTNRSKALFVLNGETWRTYVSLSQQSRQTQRTEYACPKRTWHSSSFRLFRIVVQPLGCWLLDVQEFAMRTSASWWKLMSFRLSDNGKISGAREETESRNMYKGQQIKHWYLLAFHSSLSSSALFERRWLTADCSWSNSSRPRTSPLQASWPPHFES